ncbi:hypothetical protein, partial [Selenomonas caprae]|uniref:hypothetical protein n=1 Tax=Selenomonas caprae TaxID=2606905 RepID=UPI001CA410CE
RQNAKRVVDRANLLFPFLKKRKSHNPLSAKAPWSFPWCLFVLLFCEQLRIVFIPLTCQKVSEAMVLLVDKSVDFLCVICV